MGNSARALLYTSGLKSLLMAWPGSNAVCTRGNRVLKSKGSAIGAILRLQDWAQRRLSFAYVRLTLSATAKPIPRWDVHFGGLEDDLKDSTAPHITFTPQLGATDSAV